MAQVVKIDLKTIALTLPHVTADGKREIVPAGKLDYYVAFLNAAIMPVGHGATVPEMRHALKLFDTLSELTPEDTVVYMTEEERNELARRLEAQQFPFNHQAYVDMVDAVRNAVTVPYPVK